MNYAASAKTHQHPDRELSKRQTHFSGVSFAEWRFETRAGHKAFASGNHENAGSHFANAVLIAERLAATAGLGGADPDCAIRALIAARRNVAENCLRCGKVEEADSALETVFLQLCAFAKSPGSALQGACACRISDVARILIAHLEKSAAPPARSVAVQTIIDETLFYLDAANAAQ